MTTTSKSRTNRQVKSRVFQMLFNTEEKLLELFNALEGTTYTDPGLISINTLSDSIYNNLINDLSFSLGSRYIILTEHQSTDNENMPLRLLLYYARVMEKILDTNVLLRKKLRKIPTPHFYVLYNGLKEQPPFWEMKLSSAFEEPEECPMLELTVKLININSEQQNPILQKSPTLSGYSYLVSLIRNNLQKGMPRDEAVDAAVKQCVREGVLADFLNEHAAEVTNAMFTEMSFEDGLRLLSEEAREEGLEEGRAAGRAEGHAEGRAEGRAEGIEEGRTEGHTKGIEEGLMKINELNRRLIADGRQDDLLKAACNYEFQRILFTEYNL